MLLTVGEVAEVLGLTSENIRYYVKEGLIKPARNTENNYRQYSSNDVLLISDIIFYRNMRISINNIKKIMSGIPLEDIGSVIEETEREMLEKIKEYTLALEALQSWKKHYSDEYAHLGRYSLGFKPATIRIGENYSEDEHIANYLKGHIHIEKEDWASVSMSFFCDMNKNPDTMYNYISLGSTAETVKNNKSMNLVEEPEVYCLITRAIMSDNVRDMTDPLVEFAASKGIELTGEIYGIERTNFYEGGKRSWLCSIYAPLLHPEKYADEEGNYREIKYIDQV